MCIAVSSHSPEHQCAGGDKYAAHGLMSHLESNRISVCRPTCSHPRGWLRKFFRAIVCLSCCGYNMASRHCDSVRHNWICLSCTCYVPVVLTCTCFSFPSTRRQLTPTGASTSRYAFACHCRLYRLNDDLAVCCATRFS